eukprot:138155_1
MRSISTDTKCYLFIGFLAVLFFGIQYNDSTINTKIFHTKDDANDYLESTDARFAPYRFDYSDLNTATEYLTENGYVVIKNVLNKSEINYGRSLFWEFVESPSIEWNKNDYTTWDDIKIEGAWLTGLFSGEGIGQSKFQWYGRKHIRVLNIFSTIWSIIDNKYIDPMTDLLTSFDGISIFLPWYLMDIDYKTQGGWYHIDQNTANKPGLQTFQGYISYYDQNEQTGSTVVIPKTHLKVENELDLNKKSKDFIMIDKQSRLLDSKINKKVLVNTKAGDMLLWDSRTIHCSSPALLTMDEMKKIHLKNVKSVDEIELLRLVSMICMVPKYRLNDKTVLDKRINAYVNSCTLCHWPIKYCPLWCPQEPIEPRNIDDADELTKSLIGTYS